MSKTIAFLVGLCCLCLASFSLADPPSDFCRNIVFSELPVANFHIPTSLPMEEMRITQKYNTSRADGFCTVADIQYSATDSHCSGHTVYFGHDGLDLHPQGDGPGINDVLAVQDGIVIASHQTDTFPGWGESIIIASRINAYSEELITFHYHHLHRTLNPYKTSRLFGPCDRVIAGVSIAKEGNTGNWPTHLHVSVKRWKNLAELNNLIQNQPEKIYGSGYSMGDSSKLVHCLDPEGLFYDHFNEFQQEQPAYLDWQWSLPYAKEMRYQGWFLGDFSGSFGVELNVTRREAARWIKQALRLMTADYGGPAIFYDVPPGDPDFPYINTLAVQQKTIPVINPAGSCTAGGHYFCPDQDLSRAEALKMIVAGFYHQEFLEVYNNWVWKAQAPLADNLLSHFNDVAAYSWYAPYVYFAWKNGLTGEGSFFYPANPIRRAELAKWLVIAYQHVTGAAAGYCQSAYCQEAYFCEESSLSCQPIPQCIPWENSPCPLGGGYLVGGGNGNGGTGPAQSECQAGSDQLALCPDNNGASYRVCLNTGVWSEWNPPCFDENGDGGGSAPASGGGGGPPANTYNCTADPQYASPCAAGVGICLRAGVYICNAAGDGLACNVSAGSPSPMGEICDNDLDDNCNGATDETPCQAENNGTGGQGGGTSGAGGQNTGGSGSTGTGGTAPVCTSVYHLSPAGPSCHVNTAASGSPTLCLETAPFGGAEISWRLCKQGGAFQNLFTYELLDQNHLSQYLNGQLAGSSGQTCTGWHIADFAYLNQDGPANGAGLIVEVHSPSGCASPDGTYYTGITTFYRDCQQ